MISVALHLKWSAVKKEREREKKFVLAVGGRGSEASRRKHFGHRLR